MKYAKLVVAVIVTIATALVAALAGDNLVDSVEWVNVAISGIGAAAVFTAPNIPGAAYSKAILAVLAAVLTVLASAIVGGLQTVEIIQMREPALLACMRFPTVARMCLTTILARSNSLNNHRSIKCQKVRSLIPLRRTRLLGLAGP